MKTYSCLIQDKRSFSDVRKEILQNGKETGLVGYLISFHFVLGAKHKPVIFVYELIALNI